MKILYVRAKNYIGIFQGTGGLEEIYIDFRQCKNRIVLICGRNGGGKSTLLDLLNPYPDPNNCFIPGKAGEKEIAYEHNGVTYILQFDHPVNANGDRMQTRAYIKKQTANGLSEHNPTGNITSFKDVLDVEFGLDPNFISLSKISTEDKGIVDKRPAERKMYINNIVDNVDVYNNIHKVLSKRSSVSKSLINNIVSKIDSIGDEENLRLTLKSIENRLNILQDSKVAIVKTLSESEAMIKVLDPDLSIQQLYTSIQVELETIESSLAQYDRNINHMIDNGLKSLPSAVQYIEFQSETRIMMNNLENTSTQLRNDISNILVSREEENRSIQLKTQRLDSLRSDMNFEDIKASIGTYNTNIVEYEKFFDNINIKNAIAVSKDEYVTGLHILKDIKEMVDGFKSYSSYRTIIDAITYIRSDTNLVMIYEGNEDKLKDISKQLDGLRNQLYHYNTLLSKIDILNNRPKDCKIDSCVFIKDSLEALAQDPEDRIHKIEVKIQALEEERDVISKDNQNIAECLSAVSDINIIIRNINNNSNILNKLPNGHIFSNQEEFLSRLYDGDNFEDINKLYKFIGYANIFEEYKIAKDILYKLNTDYTIYESKNEVIEELSSDIEEITLKLDNISTKITDINREIASVDQSFLELSSIQSDLDTVIHIYKKKDDLLLKKSDFESKLNAISSNMDKIQVHINSIDRYSNDLNNINNEINPLEKDRDRIKYELSVLAEYKHELKQFTDSYNLIEILRAHSSPTKKGIQHLFIKVYMNNTLNLTNELLSYLFEGRMKLLPYNIGDNGEFAIPCISMHTGMVTDDISSCSRSEKSMISMILGFVLLKQSATVYNVLKLDEVDEGLDTQNRLAHIANIERLLDILEVEQCIMVSHSAELSGQVDSIQLQSSGSSMTMDSDNVIFSL